MGNTLLQVFQGILQQDGFVKNNGKIVRAHSGARACGNVMRPSTGSDPVGFLAGFHGADGAAPRSLEAIGGRPLQRRPRFR
ncbi:hypothetical protein PWG15_00755 [Ensifer adhaerens]|uniref:hypothetical protein n=1 Tax=Ensifer adhaerens TaxID=106592 RepID=UPI0023A9B0D4|nr:hypothetical protein [Ensifer adhaerens]WDZ77072.1 hypothetical protein PWG15_00755 [Ensifer adhaerens]